jgi:hypothetical protein
VTAAPTEKTPPAPTREKGYASEPQTLGTWWNTLSNEKTPELRWPFCLDVYERMDTQDAQVSSVLRAVITPIQRTPWRVDGTGCRPEVAAHVAADLGLPIVGEGNDVPASAPAAVQLERAPGDRARGLAEVRARLLRAALRLRPERPAVPPAQARLPATAHDREVQRRPRRWPDLDRAEGHGAAGSASPGVELPVDRLVAYVHAKKGGNWIGRSLLRPAYKNWLLKDRLLRTQAQTVERNGMGIPVYTGAEDETDLDPGQEIATGVRAGDNSGAAIPYGAKLDLMGVTGTLPDADTPIRYHDEQIARAVLAHFLNLGTQTGSWALGSTFADFFTLSLQAVADEIATTATQHIVEDLVDINWGPDEPARGWCSTRSARAATPSSRPSRSWSAPASSSPTRTSSSSSAPRSASRPAVRLLTTPQEA